MKSLSFSKLALTALTMTLSSNVVSSYAYADARSVLSASCSATINGQAIALKRVSAENVKEPVVIYQDNDVVLVVDNLVKPFQEPGPLEDVYNPLGLVAVFTERAGNMASTEVVKGQNNYRQNDTEGTTTLNEDRRLFDGRKLDLKAQCELKYVE